MFAIKESVMRIFEVKYDGNVKWFNCINKAREFRDKISMKFDGVILSVTDKDINPYEK